MYWFLELDHQRSLWFIKMNSDNLKLRELISMKILRELKCPKSTWKLLCTYLNMAEHNKCLRYVTKSRKNLAESSLKEFWTSIKTATYHLIMILLCAIVQLKFFCTFKAWVLQTHSTTSTCYASLGCFSWLVMWCYGDWVYYIQALLSG